MAKRTVIRIDGKLVSPKKGKGKYRSITTPEGPRKVRILRTETGEFASEFTSAFRNNVKRAREENRALAD